MDFRYPLNSNYVCQTNYWFVRCYVFSKDDIIMHIIEFIEYSTKKMIFFLHAVTGIEVMLLLVTLNSLSGPSLDIPFNQVMEQ